MNTLQVSEYKSCTCWWINMNLAATFVNIHYVLTWFSSAINLSAPINSQTFYLWHKNDPHQGEISFCVSSLHLKILIRILFIVFNTSCFLSRWFQLCPCCCIFSTHMLRWDNFVVERQEWKHGADWKPVMSCVFPTGDAADSHRRSRSRHLPLQRSEGYSQHSDLGSDGGCPWCKWHTA